MEKGIVQRQANVVTLKDGEFRVRPAGRAKVLSQQRKNVHAFVIGDVVRVSLDSARRLSGSRPVPISYNPYRAGYFVRKDNGKKVTRAAYIFMGIDGNVLALEPR